MLFIFHIIGLFNLIYQSFIDSFLIRFKEAWKVCRQLNDNHYWKMLAEVATRQLNITFGMLLTIQTFKNTRTNAYRIFFISIS